MIRIHRTIFMSLIVLAVGAGIASAGGDPTEPGVRSPIAAELTSLPGVAATERSEADRANLRRDLDAAIGSPVESAELTSVGGVLYETKGTRLGAWATEDGAACFQAYRMSFDTPEAGVPLGSGCFHRLNEAGIEYAITITHDGIRVFGLAGDGVDRVEVTLASGAVGAVDARNNAFVWEGADVDDVPVLITTLQGRSRVEERVELDHLED
jgi:hypothetical protein